MKKTGNITAGIILLLTFCATAAFAQSDAQVSASVSSNSVFVGENFTLSIEASGSTIRQAERPALPNVDGLTLLSRTPSTSTRFSMVNGVGTATYGYTWSMRADREGVFTIPSIQVTVDGRTYSTQPVEIQASPRGQVTQGRDERPEIYLQLELSNENPYVGEQVTASLVLYFRNDIDIISYQPSSAWRTEGFWSENLNEGRSNPRAETIILNGVRYRKATLMAYALFPTRSGTLRLGSYSVRANIRYTGRYDDAARRFLSGFGRSQRAVDIESEAQEIQIRSLPSPQPETFTGAVGRFTVERKFSDQSVIVGEPVEITTRFQGTGNVALINHPRYNIPEEFERFSPQENTDLQKNGNIISGSKSFADILIPRRTGEFQIPDGEVSWFDPQQRRYISRSLPGQLIEVIRDPNQLFTHVEEARLNLRPATGVTVWRTGPEPLLFMRWWFWLLAILPLLIIGAGYQRKRYLEKMQNDRGFYRAKHASANADKLLQEADEKAASGEWREAYGLLYRVISGFITDKLNLPPSGHSDAHMISFVREKGADQALINQLSRLLDRFATIRYAPENGREAYPDDRKQTTVVLKNLKRLL